MSQKAEISENAEGSNLHLFLLLVVVFFLLLLFLVVDGFLFVCFGALNKSIKAITF